MKRWRKMERGEGYGGKRPWWPHVCGGMGYWKNGRAVCYADLVFFRRIYFRLFEMDILPYEYAMQSEEYARIGKEMSKCSPSISTTT